ncbi:hypothetical protein FHT77_006232 [Rhizobium sp. BK181]|uniref:FAD-binding domain-containing protein n=1 Tax=Rhizobium sp. BK181 TaxID=2587072 RepID=UPI001846065B|nr:FAD-binding domain-containing protein [Rhizobium sp. BK181]MBB3320313.1 hypothetical protein [Rhizobium sp. BK181]
MSWTERTLDHDYGMCQMHDAACEGLSGIDCFDAWVVELRDIGYLHNWARMQFALIWTFTLGLPWELGAAFMFSHLVDVNPASITLSWRWVAGLHTKGKAHLADADRIRAMTNGRLSPEGIARKAVIPADGIIVPPPPPVRDFTRSDKAQAAMVLITIEDLSLETLPEMHEIAIKAIAVLTAEHERDRMALNDALRRAANTWPQAAVLGSPEEDGFRTAKALGCGQVITGFSPIGPTARRLDMLGQTAAGRGMLLAEHLRSWDQKAWPFCAKGSMPSNSALHF